MTESEALRQFIPILGRISPPGERAIITRNVLERIQGRQTSVMGVSHKHAGALAWPRDTTKAQAFEAAMDAAVDAGEFVSFIHKSDRRHFQIEELASWPGCPAIAPDSPLVFWLGEPDAQQAAPQAAPPAPVADSASNDTTPDPERRLARLRALGGSATYKRGEWKIIGITALVESEKIEGRKRSDEKTIRADLKEAAQNELDARRAGFGAGLGQR